MAAPSELDTITTICDSILTAIIDARRAARINGTPHNLFGRSYCYIYGTHRHFSVESGIQTILGPDIHGSVKIRLDKPRAATLLSGGMVCGRSVEVLVEYDQLVIAVIPDSVISDKVRVALRCAVAAIDLAAPDSLDMLGIALARFGIPFAA